MIVVVATQQPCYYLLIIHTITITNTITIFPLFSLFKYITINNMCYTSSHSYSCHSQLFIPICWLHIMITYNDDEGRRKESPFNSIHVHVCMYVCMFMKRKKWVVKGIASNEMIDTFGFHHHHHRRRRRVMANDYTNSYRIILNNGQYQYQYQKKYQSCCSSSSSSSSSS